ncbi:MAG: GIY-YIG nuclease family protein [Elusimicrobia bacterium]|nr:GIY-YIG nuclease family protein [Elusimicrobiota bacterium]
MAEWKVYILKCADGSFYTGITTDIDRRIKEHNQAKASKYTRGRLPVELFRKTSQNLSQSHALSLEYKIKSLSKKDKENIKNIL